VRREIVGFRTSIIYQHLNNTVLERLPDLSESEPASTTGRDPGLTCDDAARASRRVSARPRCTESVVQCAERTEASFGHERPTDLRVDLAL